MIENIDDAGSLATAIYVNYEPVYTHCNYPQSRQNLRRAHKVPD